MLVEMGIADAYGSAFEFADNLDLNTVKMYINHPRHKGAPGRYTDDTQMSIAIAELMLYEKEWTPLIIANKFVEVFKRDQRTGYAHRFYAFLQEIKSGKEFLKKIKPDSEKGGAAMRSAPLGFIKDLDAAKKLCTIQAAITHNTENGINSAIIAMMMAHYFINKLGTKDDLQVYLALDGPSGPWLDLWQGKVGSKGMDIVHAAVTAVVTSESLQELLYNCIDFGGDVDTVAAIAMSAASHCDEYEKDIPENLILCLENGKYGKDFLAELDEKLVKRFQPQLIVV